VAEYACDGIVFSTPTGSTAYNLAAGGPIAHPEAQVLLMTPISAHTLTSRSVVFPSGVSLSIQSERNPDEPLVSADGQPAFEVPAAFPIEVRVADQSFPLLEEKNHSHFHILRSKLKWG
jgi:NAD+ kinase